MTARQILLPILGLLTPLLVASGMEAAPPIQASARAARSTVQVGEPVRITIHVTNSDEIPQIDAPTADGMSISSTGTAEATPSVLRNVRPLPTGRVPASKLIASLRDLSKNLGNASAGMPNLGDPRLAQQHQAMLKQGLGNINRSDYDMLYLATPEQVGRLTVPAFTVHSGGQTMRTQPLDLMVIEARPSPWVKASLSLSNSEPSAGDTVNLYVDLLVRRPTQQLGRGHLDLKSQPINHVTLKVPSLEGYAEIRPLEPLEKYVEKRRLPQGQLGYHINSFPGVILLEQESAGAANVPDPQWYRRRLTIPFHVLQAGEMELPPLRVAGEVYVPAGGKSRYAWEGFVASSAPLKFRIRDAANRPADPRQVTPAPVPNDPAKGAADPPRNAEEPSSSEESLPLVEHSFPVAARWEMALAVVLLLAGIAVGLRRRPVARRQHATRLRQQQAIAKAQQRLHTPPLTAAEVSAAVQDFLRAYLGMEPGEITPEDASERLTQAGYPTERAESCAEVLRTCAAEQFAPGQTPSRADDLAVAADRILGAILAAQPKQATVVPSSVDELTRARQAALAD